MRDNPQMLHCYPDLFLFALRYQLLTLVAHHLEGTHRTISLQASGCGASTTPAFHDYKLRERELQGNLKVQNFLDWASVQWKRNAALEEPLAPLYDTPELRRLSYEDKVHKIFGADLLSQFSAAPHLAEVANHVPLVLGFRPSQPTFKGIHRCALLRATHPHRISP